MHWGRETIQKMIGPVTWAGVLRIVLWTIVFIGIVGQLVPDKHWLQRSKLLERSNVTSMLFKEGGIAKSPAQFPPGEHKNLAWVFGSSAVSIMKPPEEKYLPINTARQLRQLSKKDVKGYYYLLYSQRFLDVYVLVQDALARSPDVLVVALNPAWVFNNLSIFNRDEAIQTGSLSWLNTQDLFLWLNVTTPSNHFANFLGGSIPLIMPPNRYRKHLLFQQEKMFGLAVPQITDNTDQFYHFDSSLGFWMNHLTERDQLSNPNEEDITWDRKQWQADNLQRAQTAADSFAMRKFPNMLRQIEDSGIPTLFYLSPPSPSLDNDPLASEGYRRIVTALKKMRAQNPSKNIEFIIDIPDPVQESIRYLDYIHIHDFGKLERYLANRINRLMDKKQ